MAKKGKTQQKQTASKHVTTRRLARWEREKRRQRITFLSGIVIIVAVLGIVIGGIVATRSSDWLSKVEMDSSTVTIRKADYADQLKLLFAVGAYNSSTITNDAPLRTIEDSLLIEDGAKEAGLAVTDSEVDDIIRTMFETNNESITDTDFQEQYQNFLDYIGLSDEEYRGVLTDQLLSNKLRQHYLDLIPESGEQASLEFVIVANESDAVELAQRWRNGEELAALSAEYGGESNAGWFPKGYAGEDFDNVAFSIEIGDVSDPFTISNAGDASEAEDYYVIKVLERKDDVIADSTRQVWGYKDYTAWEDQAYTDKVERNPKLDLAEVYAWAVEQLQ